MELGRAMGVRKAYEQAAKRDGLSTSEWIIGIQSNATAQRAKGSYAATA